MSTFDADTEGWSLWGDYRDPAKWMNSGGNPGGYVKGVDRGGSVWGFLAPAEFLGNQSAAYGQTLSYDLWISARDSSDLSYPDVELKGGGLTFNWFDAWPSVRAWNTFTVALGPTGNWVKSGTTVAPTEAEWHTLLGSVSRLSIRGEYKTGDDYAGLDNVVLNSVPEPSSLVMLASLGAMGLIGRAWRKRKQIAV